MRILVTNNGKNEIKDILTLIPVKTKTENSFNETSFAYFETLKSQSRQSRSKSNKSRKSRKNHSKSPPAEDILHYTLTDGSSYNEGISSSLKIIEVKQKKIDVPKNLFEKFNKVDNSNSSILPNLPLNILRKEYNQSSFMYNKLDNDAKNFLPRQPYSLKEIITPQSLINLKVKIRDEKKLKDKYSKIDSSNFRTIYKEKNVMQEFNHKLEKEIKPDRVNLIKYINEKESISEKLITQIAESDEERINKLNKVCQIGFHYRENQTETEIAIKEKIKQIKVFEKKEYRATIDSMKTNTDNARIILGGYNIKKKNDAKEREVKFKDMYMDMKKKYWDNYGIDRLQRKKNKLNNFNANSSFVNTS